MTVAFDLPLSSRKTSAWTLPSSDSRRDEDEGARWYTHIYIYTRVRKTSESARRGTSANWGKMFVRALLSQSRVEIKTERLERAEAFISAVGCFDESRARARFQITAWRELSSARLHSEVFQSIDAPWRPDTVLLSVEVSLFFSPRPSLPGGSSLLCLRKMFSERKREVERESRRWGFFFLFLLLAGLAPRVKSYDSAAEDCRRRSCRWSSGGRWKFRMIWSVRRQVI